MGTTTKCTAFKITLVTGHHYYTFEKEGVADFPTPAHGVIACEATEVLLKYGAHRKGDKVFPGDIGDYPTRLPAVVRECGISLTEALEGPYVLAELHEGMRFA